VLALLDAEWKPLAKNIVTVLSLWKFNKESYNKSISACFDSRKPIKDLE
jgi:hypothetical protein